MVRFRIELPERGVELAAMDWGGEGPLAVLSHANGFCSSVYEPLAQRLRERFRVVAFDSRGHGASSVPDPDSAYEWSEFVGDWRAVARSLGERLGAPCVGLGVGHSFGGSTLLHAAVAESGLFDRLVVLDPVLIPPPGERSGPFEGEGPHPMAVAARRRTPSFPSREAVRESWARRGVFADWAEGVLDRYLEDGFHEAADGSVELACPPRVEAAIYQAGPRSDLFEPLRTLEVPTLWLHAAAGNFPFELAQRAAGACPSVELRSLPLAHLMPMTHPQEIARQILDWCVPDAR